MKKIFAIIIFLSSLLSQIKAQDTCFVAVRIDNEKTPFVVKTDKGENPSGLIVKGVNGDNYLYTNRKYIKIINESDEHLRDKESGRYRVITFDKGNATTLDYSVVDGNWAFVEKKVNNFVNMIYFGGDMHENTFTFLLENNQNYKRVLRTRGSFGDFDGLKSIDVIVSPAEGNDSVFSFAESERVDTIKLKPNQTLKQISATRGRYGILNAIRTNDDVQDTKFSYRNSNGEFEEDNYSVRNATIFTAGDELNVSYPCTISIEYSYLEGDGNVQTDVKSIYVEVEEDLLESSTTWIWIVITLLLIGGIGFYFYRRYQMKKAGLIPETDREKIARLQKEVATHTATIKDLESRETNLLSDKKALQDKVEALNTNLAVSRQETKDKTTESDGYKNALDNLQIHTNDLQSKLDQSLERIRVFESDEVLHKLTKEVADTKAAAEKEISEVKQAAANEIAEVKDASAKEIAVIKETAAKEIAETKANADATVTETKEAAAKEVAEIKAEAEEVMLKAKETAETLINKTKAEAEALVTETKATAEAEVSKTKADAEFIVNKTKSETETLLNNTERNANAAILKTKENAAAEIAAITEKYTTELTETKANAETIVSETKAAAARKIAETKETAAREIAETKETAAREVAETKVNAEAAIAAITAKSNAEVAEVKETAAREIAETKAEAEAAIAEARTNADTIASKVKAETAAEIEEIEAKAEKAIAQEKERTREAYESISAADNKYIEFIKSSVDKIKQNVVTLQEEIANSPFDNNHKNVINHLSMKFIGFTQWFDKNIVIAQATEHCTKEEIEEKLLNELLPTLTNNYSWVTELVRFYSYTSINRLFTEEFRKCYVPVDSVQLAYTETTTLFGKLGVTLYLPHLFVDDFNKELHKMNNAPLINGFFPQGYIEFKAENRGLIYDLLRPGYSINGIVQQLPEVSVF